MNKRSDLRMLVAIASYGTEHALYLSQLVREYRSMSFHVDVVVLSNVHKTVDEGVELVVGLPNKNPWTLPFPHKKIFADRLNDYDLFLYSEDDVLISENNIHAFLRACQVLPDDVIPGFLRFEQNGSGVVSYPEVHAHFHWEPESVLAIGEYQFARFTNEHSACYLITREQLRRAIDSGGFLVGPHDGEYDLLCTAATDPYTQCGFRKLLCISHLEDFLIPHLPAKYVEVNLGVREAELRRQVGALLKIGQNGHRPRSLFSTETKMRGKLFSKDYYEPVMPETISVIPSRTRSVLSVGCGWGATEAQLAARGLEVVAVPLDVVICGGAEAAGVEIVDGGLDAACQKLEGRQFDCLLLPNILHLVDDPPKVLSSFAQLLAPGAVAVVVIPNLFPLRVTYEVVKKAASMRHETYSATFKNLNGEKTFGRLRDFEATGVRHISPRALQSWFEAAGLKQESSANILPHGRASRLTFGLIDHLLATRIIAVARRT